MNHRTHRNIAKLLFPDVTWKTIDDINSIVDNPTQKSMMFNETFSQQLPDPEKPGQLKYYNPFDVWHLGDKIPHRRVNHDPVSATAMGFMEYGARGAILSNLHVLLDVASEEIKKNFGISERDYWEANMNYMLERAVLPQLLQRQKMLHQVTSAAVHGPVRRTYSKKSKNKRMLMSQRLDKPFIPTRAYYPQ